MADTTFIKNAINIQYERCKLGQIFTPEAQHIAKLAGLAKAKTVTDMGCWVGLLAEEVFKEMPKLQKYYAVDAVPLFIEVAKEKLKGKPVEFIAKTLVPRLGKIQEVPVMNIVPFDTLNTSSIYTGRTIKTDAKFTALPAAENTFITPFVQEHADTLFAPSSYVKIDLDGVDLALVDTILSNDCKPAVIQFECWKFYYKRGLGQLIAKLKAAGYAWPDDFKPEDYNHFSMAVGKKHWWAVGYLPNEFIPNSFLPKYTASFTL